MVLNLATAFPSSSILTWNRTPKLDALAEHPSITATESASDVLKSAHITFSMLSTPAAMRAVLLDDALHTIPHGGCLVDCSTLQVSDMQAVRDVVKTRGGFFLEAPVSGSKVPAEKGQLIFLCGGDETLFQHSVVQKAFDAMGKRALFLGDVGAGTKMKLVVNQLMATMLAALSESIVLTEALDLSVPDLLEVLCVYSSLKRRFHLLGRRASQYICSVTDFSVFEYMRVCVLVCACLHVMVRNTRSLGAMNNPMFALKGPMMKSGEKRYDTNFPLEHAQKDVRFAQALGDEHGISMAVSSAANGTSFPSIPFSISFCWI